MFPALRTCLALATLLTLSGAWANSPPDAPSPLPSDDLAAPTLSRQLEFDMAKLFNVLEVEEGAAHARYRLVTRLSAGAVARRLGEALPAPWQPQPTRPDTNPHGPLGALGGLSGRQLSYLNEVTAQSLRHRVFTLGRSISLQARAATCTLLLKRLEAPGYGKGFARATNSKLISGFRLAATEPDLVIRQFVKSARLLFVEAGLVATGVLREYVGCRAAGTRRGVHRRVRCVALGLSGAF
jgi:hypothetical protein